MTSTVAKAAPAPSIEAIEAVLRLLEKESPAPILNGWPQAAKVVVIPPAIAKARAVTDAGQYNTGRGAYELWDETRALLVPPSGERLDLMLSRTTIPSPVLHLQCLLAALLKGAAFIARVEAERDQLSEIIRQYAALGR